MEFFYAEVGLAFFQHQGILFHRINYIYTCEKNERILATGRLLKTFFNFKSLGESSRKFESSKVRNQVRL